MKKILITGVNSYIGISFKKWLQQWPDGYKVDTVDMKDGAWKEKDFSGYDVLFHVAGIAHIKETKENAALYYKVNRDLVYEVALKAKNEGVRQFIFMSTMNVYGVETGVITKDTIPNPKTNYAKSKLQAEDVLRDIADDNFRVCVLRPPMVYGKSCKGNFQSLVKIVKKFPTFPKIQNKRSMVYIVNLCAFIKLCVDRRLSGLYFPQNKEYVRTDEMARLIADVFGKKLFMSRLLGDCVWVLSKFVKKAEKAFGSLIYKDTEDFNFGYCVCEFEKTVTDSF